MRPKFVTETDEARWTDCTWASAVMGIDKQTGGVMRPNREKLRVASGTDNEDDGANMRDVVRGAKNLLDLTLEPWSPTGGARITFDQMLTGLTEGKGYMLAGNYSRLPTYFRRWSPRFFGNHMVYIEEVTRNAIWWMDPLGSGTYKGEWIPTVDARKFATSLAQWPDGAIYAAPFTPPKEETRENEVITFQRGNTYITRANLRAGTKLLDAPNGKTVETIHEDRFFDYAGYPNDNSEWRIVVWPVPMPMGGPAQRGLFVPRTAVLNYQGQISEPQATEKLLSIRAMILELSEFASAD